jgi:hypothetical protein
MFHVIPETKEIPRKIANIRSRLEQIVRCPQEKNETVILYYRSD